MCIRDRPHTVKHKPVQDFGVGRYAPVAGVSEHMKGNACPFYNLFHGLVYCATCGKSMQVRYEKVGRPGKKRFTGAMREPIDKAYYICQTYNRMCCKVCSSHKIEARDLYLSLIHI